MSALGLARNHIVATHKELSVAQNQIGLGAINVVADGSGGTKPTSEMPAATPQLRPVRAVQRAA
jgi:hypothetical protein